jgi:hypothetical protein
MKNFIVVLLLVFSAGLIFSNPAKSVDLSYDATKGELTVVAMHKVTDPAKHFIKDITVSINGKVVEKKSYTSQTSKTEQNAVIKVSAKAGDKIFVNTLCSWGGNKGAEIVVK